MAPDAEPPETVPGVQRERTALAWERTGIGFLIVGLLFIRAAHRPAWQLPGLGALLLGVGLVVAGARSYAHGRDARSLMSQGAVRLVAWSLAALSLLAVAMILDRMI